MDNLWTPWRYSYVSTVPAAPQPESCVFCRIAADAAHDAENLVILRASANFVVLNRYPYSNGHLMIVPYAHVATLEHSAPEALAEMMQLTQRMERVLRSLYRPEGMNFGLNIGQSAGAGVAGHIHMHGLPRWTGDTSFMTTVGETRVLPEDLGTTRQRLLEQLRREP